MKLTVELDENEIRKILTDHINNKFGTTFEPHLLPIEVKSKQNYRSEWETANIRVQFSVHRS